MKTFNIERSQSILINTDPQRRCYNGCHARTELHSKPWETFESGIPEDKIESRLVFWTELNNDAVLHRGGSARVNYRIVQGETNGSN